MTKRSGGPGGAGARGLDRAEGFESDLRQRAEAARGLEQDLLTEVPLLYGSPGAAEAEGDPGIVLARLHRENLLHRNGGGAPSKLWRRGDNPLPFENAISALAILILIAIFVFG